MTLKNFIGSEAEREVFFNEDEFADSASYTPQEGGGPYTIKGIYNASYAALNAQGRAVESYIPTFTCFLADLPGTIEGGLLTVNP